METVSVNINKAVDDFQNCKERCESCEVNHIHNTLDKYKLCLREDADCADLMGTGLKMALEAFEEMINIKLKEAIEKLTGGQGE